MGFERSALLSLIFGVELYLIFAYVAHELSALLLVISLLDVVQILLLLYAASLAVFQDRVLCLLKCVQGARSVCLSLLVAIGAYFTWNLLVLLFSRKYSKAESDAFGSLILCFLYGGRCAAVCVAFLVSEHETQVKIA